MKRMFSSLTREQKEAIGLLQIGTFLEYFDLMLYVHMAVLLNELFFPKTDVSSAALLSAFAFCSTYVLRPFGALLFGYVGDTIGRKTTVIITTIMMATSCIIMANLPTYAQVGISASWVVTICRMAQGLSSLGEIMGAEIYLTEITKPPMSYVAVSMIGMVSAVGSIAALCIATLSTRQGFNWRIAFWIGAAIAVVGSVARTRLRETPDFIEMKEKTCNSLSKENGHNKAKKIWLFQSHTRPEWKTKIPFSTSLHYFLVHCGWPLTFYLGYMYFNPTLREMFGYSPEDIIIHNLLLATSIWASGMLWVVLSLYIHPLRILKVRGLVALVLMLCLPFLLQITTSATQIFIWQFLILTMHTGSIPADAVFIKQFPVYKRFTATTFLYAMTRAVMYVITSFGVVYLSRWFGHKGLLFLNIPSCLGFLLGVRYFEKLERLKASVDTIQFMQKVA
jgi:MFS family permease